jgi:DNA-directed RNA polymerase specialized sigma24 family protein
MTDGAELVPASGGKLARADSKAASQEVTARKRFHRITREYVRAATDFADAVEQEDWKFLGYSDIEEWRSALFSEVGRLTAPARKEVVRRLTVSGKTVREIAAATGASRGTVNNDQAEARVQGWTEDGVP